MPCGRSRSSAPRIPSSTPTSACWSASSRVDRQAVKPVILFAILAAIVSGICSALQAPTNALLARGGANSPVNAALISFAVGTLALLAVALALGVRPNLSAMRGLPPYVWLGGLYGAFFVFAGAFAAPRIGLAYFAVLLL